MVMVYVISKDGKPLMPTERYGKVRRLLKQKLAKVVRLHPFTIQLEYDTTTYTQPVSLGIDSGYTYIGYSAITDKRELISGVFTLLSDISERLAKKREYRRLRRSRLRYRKPRFDNRKKPEGWLPPSIQHKVDSHIRFINLIKSILPITCTTIEVAVFDIQKIKDPTIQGIDYQHGEQKGFYNLREYILYRDNYTCQLCGKTNLPLRVHHIGYWKGDLTNKPSNVITLCTQCASPKNHLPNEKLYGWKPKLKPFKEETFMSILRKRLANTLNCNFTYGYLTKARRIELNLEKTHYNDAFCIAGGTENHTRIEPINFGQTRRNNRSLERFYDAKYIDISTGKSVKGVELFNGRTTRNKNLNSENLHKYRGKKISKGRRQIRRKRYPYQHNDLVKFNGKVYVVDGATDYGKYIILQGLSKAVRTNLIQPYKFSKGMYVNNKN